MQKLAANHDIQRRLYDEMVEVKKRMDGNDLTYELINGMKYAEMVIFEGLRMCKIAPELKRRATRPYVLENSNGDTVTIQPGDGVWLPAFILQNDPQYYPSPEKFDPERFSDENKKSHVPGTYGPFGMGPRDCIGCLYPMAELKITLYHLLVNFSIESVNDMSNSVKLVQRAQ